MSLSLSLFPSLSLSLSLFLSLSLCPSFSLQERENLADRDDSASEADVQDDEWERYRIQTCALMTPAHPKYVGRGDRRRAAC